MLRIATPDDIEKIGKLLWMMTAEIGVGRVNEQKAREAVNRTLLERDSCCILAERKGAVVGCLGLVMTAWWYSDDRFLTDLFFFVHPDHRADKNDDGENGGHATRLVSVAKVLARKKGVPLVLQVGTDIDPIPKIRFMRKHMEPFGGAFIFKPEAA